MIKNWWPSSQIHFSSTWQQFHEAIYAIEVFISSVLCGTCLFPSRRSLKMPSLWLPIWCVWVCVHISTSPCSAVFLPTPMSVFAWLVRCTLAMCLLKALSFFSPYFSIKVEAAQDASPPPLPSASLPPWASPPLSQPCRASTATPPSVTSTPWPTSSRYQKRAPLKLNDIISPVCKASFTKMCLWPVPHHILFKNVTVLLR